MSLPGVLKVIKLIEQKLERLHFVAAMDERTCEICASHHCKTYPVGEEPEVPLHPNCRCHYEPA